ncbi:hypothetical protein LXA43DRAFT_247000 [Ganoderma leucocontextum]|nr:hypothetical protein LXA43DRAFT_247000 [Ganoderma leucocontextum]
MPPLRSPPPCRLSTVPCGCLAPSHASPPMVDDRFTTKLPTIMYVFEDYSNSNDVLLPNSGQYTTLTTTHRSLPRRMLATQVPGLSLQLQGSPSTYQRGPRRPNQPSSVTSTNGGADIERYQVRASPHQSLLNPSRYRNGFHPAHANTCWHRDRCPSTCAHRSIWFSPPQLNVQPLTSLDRQTWPPAWIRRSVSASHRVVRTAHSRLAWATRWTRRIGTVEVGVIVVPTSCESADEEAQRFGVQTTWPAWALCRNRSVSGSVSLTSVPPSTSALHVYTGTGSAPTAF